MKAALVVIAQLGDLGLLRGFRNRSISRDQRIHLTKLRHRLHSVVLPAWPRRANHSDDLNLPGRKSADRVTASGASAN